MARFTRLVHALAALTLLIALLVGVPLVLQSLSSDLLPRRVDLNALAVSLRSPDDGRLLVVTLVLVGWLTWASLAVSIAVEAGAQLRRVRAPRIRGLRLQQHLVSGLVAAAIGIIITPAALATTPASSFAATATATSQTVAPDSPDVMWLPDTNKGAADSPTPSSAVRASTTHTVRSGDSLWLLADRYLGDGQQWPRILRANSGLIDDPQMLQTGWVLNIPDRGFPEARERSAMGRATAKTATHVVRGGESLWGIAADHLGSGRRWAEILRVNQQLIRDPKLLRVGWVLEIPSERETRGNSGRAHQGTPQPRSAVKNSADSARPPEGNNLWFPSGTGSTTARTGAPSSGPALTGGTPLAVDPSGRTGAATEMEHSAAAQLTTGRSEVGGGHSDNPIARTSLGTGAVLAAGVVGLLLALRRNRARRRRAGERLTYPELQSLRETESQFQAVADTDGVLSLDRALRHLAAHQRTQGTPLPRLRAARLTPAHIELYLSEPSALPRPWVDLVDRTVWALRHVDVPRDAGSDTRSPYPALVTVGQDQEDAHLLLDLEEIASLAVEGSPAEIIDTFAALTLELATSRWSDDIQITLVGVLRDLPAAVPTGRIRYVDHLELLMPELEARVQDIRALMQADGVADLRQARGSGLAEDAWTPEILMLGAGVPEHLRHRVQAAIHQAPGVGLAAITCDTAPLGEWRLSDRSKDLATLEPAAIRLRPQRMSADELRAVLALLDGAAAPPIAGPDWSQPTATAEVRVHQLRTTQHPASRETTVTAAVEAAVEEETVAEVIAMPIRAPRLRVLGAVRIDDATGPVPTTYDENESAGGQESRAAELVGYLTVHRAGATLAELSRALYPGHPLGLERTAKLVSRTRRWLGGRDDGRPWLARAAADGRILLADDVRTDWEELLERLRPSLRGVSDSALREAAELITGAPLAEVPRGRWAWAEEWRHDIVAGAVDLLHEIAARAIRRGDAETARWAASKGRELDPDNELLWRDALRAEYVTGDPDEQARLTAQLLAQTDELEIDLDPATEELLDDLQRVSGQ